MIEYIKGTLEELTPTLAVVDCSGVGYGLNISLGTYAAIQGQKEVKLFVYEAVREDAYILWGFATKSERELFLQLTSVSGIGAAMARMILSALSPAELVEVISSGNDRVLCERHRSQSCTAHHRGPERQNTGTGYRPDKHFGDSPRHQQGNPTGSRSRTNYARIQPCTLGEGSWQTACRRTRRARRTNHQESIETFIVSERLEVKR